MNVVFNKENRAIGAYENTELNAEGLDTLAQRDFPNYISINNDNDNIIYEDEENLDNEQWIAGLIDRAQEAGWFVTMENNLIHIGTPLSFEIARGTGKTSWIEFNNWSEVELWLEENNF